MTTITPKQKFNRWTVIRASTPAMRRPYDTGPRARVVARCACGEECVVWFEDVTRGLSTGCRSKRCRARFEAVQELLAQRDRFASVADVIDFANRWVSEGRARDEERAMQAIEEEEERQARRQEGGAR